MSSVPILANQFRTVAQRGKGGHEFTKLIPPLSHDRAAVVLDVDEYERMAEELELLREIHAAEKELAKGRGVSHQQARERALKALES